MEICDLPVSYTDNPQGNIIHKKLHDELELDEIEKAENHLNKVFELNDQRPIIKPLDFTSEWRKHRKRLLERAHRGEDDEIDFDHEGQGNKIRQQMLEILGKEQKAEEPLQDVQQSEEEADDPSYTPSIESESPEERLPEQETEQLVETNEPELETVMGSDEEFVETPFVDDRPDQAKQEIDEEELDKIYEEAKSKGYEEGFRQGEERALIAASQRIAAIHNELNKVIEELTQQEKIILEGSKEKFYVITKALVESLLQKEFKEDPASFMNIINRAINETISSKDYVVYVSESMYESLKSTQEDTSRIKIDESIGEFDFRVDSEDMTLKTNYREIIDQLISEAKQVS